MSDTLPTATVAAQPASEQPSVTIEVNATLLDVMTYDCNNGQCGTLGQHKIDDQPLYVQDNNSVIVATLRLQDNQTVDVVVPATSGITIDQLRQLTGQNVRCQIDAMTTAQHREDLDSVKREDLDSVKNGSTHSPAVLIEIEAAAELSR